MNLKTIRDRLVTIYSPLEELEFVEFESVIFETDSYELANKVQWDWLLLGVHTDRVPRGSLNIVRPVSKLDERVMYDVLYEGYCCKDCLDSVLNRNES